jgi:hypothetical protein
MTLNALKEHNTIFVSAQPDEIYFHWQVEVYLYQFAKHGIEDRCYALFGYRDTPSAYALELQKKFKHILLYKDTRDRNIPNYYIPSIRPHLLKQFFAEYPDLGKSVFYHDSDIFLVRLPRFELLLGDELNYVSDTVSYIGSNYIEECQARYTAVHPEAAKDPILTRMCTCVGVSEDLIRQNNANSGGAQYLLKDIDAAFWEEAETLCQKLYTCMNEYDVQYPISKVIQAWTADMWVVLWLLLKRGSQVRLHDDLAFSWGVSSAAEYFKKPIFHLAGVTPKTSEGKFYKGNYTTRNIFREFARDPTIFDNLDPQYATYEYIRVLKEYAQGYTASKYQRFLFNSTDAWSSIYSKDSDVTVHGRPLWRSIDKKFIIFHNTNSWVVTSAQYESSLPPGAGGHTSTTRDEPYDGGWNVPCTIRMLE